MPDGGQLEARAVEARYGPDAPPILAQLTLEIRRGEFMGVVGPNGSGKSTLVRALSRVLRPSQGVVLIAGLDVYAGVSAREAACRIGVVPQETSVAFDFTVREVVEMGRAPRLPRRPFAALTAADEHAVREALRLAEVEHLAERAVTTLSGGERQRTLLARALAQEADVLLLDEPTAHLDLHHQTQALTLVRALAHEHGKAVMAVLHDLNLAAAYCDRLILLDAGHVAAQGTPEEVLTPERLRQVYGARVWIRRHPVTDRPYLLSLPEDPTVPRRGRTVHVLCGNGTGAALLFGLAQQGFAVTVGGLSPNDPDAEAADLLGFPYPHAAPFSPLSDATVAEMRHLAAQADAVVLSEVPFGPSNLVTLETALIARRAGLPVFCIQPPQTPFRERDFTGGVATALWKQLLDAGAVAVADVQAALTQISIVFE